MSRRLRFGSALVVMVLAAACSGRADDPGVDGSPAPRPAVPSATATVVGGGNVSLGCSDSIGTQPGESVDAVPFRGLATTGTEPPLAQDVLGFTLPPGMAWHFRKNPLTMRPGAADVTVSVSGSSQALLWVPASVWTTQGQRPDVSRWAASSLTLHSCPDRAAVFLGGILAQDQDTCLDLTVHQAGRPDQRRQQRLDGTPCVP